MATALRLLTCLPGTTAEVIDRFREKYPDEKEAGLEVRLRSSLRRLEVRQRIKGHCKVKGGPKYWESV